MDIKKKSKKKFNSIFNVNYFFKTKRYLSFFLYLAVAFVLGSYTFGWIEKLEHNQEPDYSVFTNTVFLVTFFLSILFFLCYFASQIFFINKLKLKKLSQYFLGIFIFFIFIFIIEIFLFSVVNINKVILTIASLFTIIFAIICLVSDSLIIVILLKIENRTILEPSKSRALYVYDDEDNLTIETNWQKIKDKIDKKSLLDPNLSEKKNKKKNPQ